MKQTFFSVVAMVAVVVGALSYMNHLGLSVTDNVGVREAELRIANANGLVPGSRVLYRGVAIGKITAVDAEPDVVRVKWNYKDEYSIPASSQFRVDNLSALGETYLGVLPPARADGANLSQGAVLTASSIVVPTTFDELSARVVRVLNQLPTTKVNTIVDEFNRALPSDEGVITDLNTAGVLLQSAIVSTTGQFGDLLVSFQDILGKGSGISSSLGASGQPIDRMAEQIKHFLDWCATFIVKDNLPTSLTDGAGPFLEKLQTFLNKAAPDIKILGDAALPSITPAAAKLRTVDLSQLMRTALATAGRGDALTLRVGPTR